jgi:serine/threonine protein phosphatase PrpC
MLSLAFVQKFLFQYRSANVQERDHGLVPRIWLPTAPMPGAAFSRSIGDAVAERVGVIAEPDVLTLRLTSWNPFFVLATDGVWDYMTPQEVVTLVARCPEPQSAADAVADEAKGRWLTQDSRSDDVSIIVVQVVRFFSCVPLPWLSSSCMDLQWHG